MATTLPTHSFFLRLSDDPVLEIASYLDLKNVLCLRKTSRRLAKCIHRFVLQELNREKKIFSSKLSVSCFPISLTVLMDSVLKISPTDRVSFGKALQAHHLYFHQRIISIVKPLLQPEVNQATPLEIKKRAREKPFLEDALLLTQLIPYHSIRLQQSRSIVKNRTVKNWDETEKIIGSLPESYGKSELISLAVSREDIPLVYAENLAAYLSDEEKRSWLLYSLAVKDPIPWLDAIGVAKKIPYVPVRARALSLIAKRIDVPLAEAQKIAFLIPDRFPYVTQRLQALYEIAIRKEVPWEEALNLAKKLDPCRCSLALYWIALRTDLKLEEAEQVALEIQDHTKRSEALSLLIKREETPILIAKRLALSIPDPVKQAWALYSIIGKEEMPLDEAKSIAASISVSSRRSMLFARIAQRKDLSLAEAQQIVQAIPHELPRLDALFEISKKPDLSWQEAEQIAQSIPNWSAELKSSLALDAELRSEALYQVCKRETLPWRESERIARSIPDENQLSMALFFTIKKPDIPWKEAIRIAFSIPLSLARSNALSFIARRKDLPWSQAEKISLEIPDELLRSRTLHELIKKEAIPLKESSRVAHLIPNDLIRSKAFSSILVRTNKLSTCGCPIS